jgi:hypothetical protein
VAGNTDRRGTVRIIAREFFIIGAKNDDSLLGHFWLVAVWLHMNPHTPLTSLEQRLPCLDVIFLFKVTEHGILLV